MHILIKKFPNGIRLYLNPDLDFEDLIKEIAANIKNNKNQLEYRTIVQALTKVFNSSNIYVKCSCEDFKYRFAH
jgi:hypothetical protein